MRMGVSRGVGMVEGRGVVIRGGRGEGREVM